MSKSALQKNTQETVLQLLEDLIGGGKGAFEWKAHVKGVDGDGDGLATSSRKKETAHPLRDELHFTVSFKVNGVFPFSWPFLAKEVCDLAEAEFCRRQLFLPLLGGLLAVQSLFPLEDSLKTANQQTKDGDGATRLQKSVEALRQESVFASLSSSISSESFSRHSSTVSGSMRSSAGGRGPLQRPDHVEPQEGRVDPVLKPFTSLGTPLSSLLESIAPPPAPQPDPAARQVSPAAPQSPSARERRGAASSSTARRGGSALSVRGGQVSSGGREEVNEVPAGAGRGGDAVEGEMGRGDLSRDEEAREEAEEREKRRKLEARLADKRQKDDKGGKKKKTRFI
uniref:Uncharacterized protein n=1 Tax=Chromera velia CCMP2878 TaxID=1169474 RepID=A0A0G4HYE7_9ALVE|eukprot:Cvel_9479.t1-p1 / transcript=Cvel_9479.t1 / gene=Cvel_9479 / organism=Chromera_velia_CCMP2878 / gene_product=hypothetical protein / transcript_product=hypothetical protein / location=Cvel_scaffold547:52131-53260(+) / protein_length=339 / sequence_SO=supercontig / SO=protein_coding / is_pseudo=false